MNVTTIRPRALAAIATLGLLTAAACKRGQDGDARAETAAAVPGVTIGRENIAIVQSSNIQSGPAISGSLAPEREATIRAQIGGPVLQTFADEGQHVAAGTSLARIDDAAIRDSYLSARSGVTSAQSTADVASRELQRSETLLAAGAVAERDVENARRVNVAAQAGLADARARLANASKQLEDTRVTAPFSGIVGSRMVNAGDVVAPGGAMFTVVEPSSMRLEASVPAEELPSLRVGAPVSFTVSGYPNRQFAGKITRVSPVADPATRQVKIIASIPNAGSTLVGGLFAEGRVASESRVGPVVPASAVDERGVAPSVMRLKGGRAERVAVALGLRDAASETVEIKSGLTPGDTVLLGAAQGIGVGTPVRVSDPGDRPATVKN
jgi:RND family efflux transporter MFP subunit